MVEVFEVIEVHKAHFSSRTSGWRPLTECGIRAITELERWSYIELRLLLKNALKEDAHGIISRYLMLYAEICIFKFYTQYRLRMPCPVMRLYSPC